MTVRLSFYKDNRQIKMEPELYNRQMTLIDFPDYDKDSDYGKLL